MAENREYGAGLAAEISQAREVLLEKGRVEYDRKGRKLLELSLDFLEENCPPAADEKRAGMPLILFSLGLARLTVEELGLDALGLSAALLIPLFEQCEMAPEQVRVNVGERPAQIIEELLKINELETQTSSSQAENMRNLILTLATDFRVILVKIAERLFHMRLLVQLPEKDQITFACESRFIYSPLAHRLGLYNVMSEMEDISMSILEKEAYQQIDAKLKATMERRQQFIEDFIKPIEEDLEREKIKAEIKGRPKAISSIWRKMKKQNVDYEEVYDRFAIRIILDTSLKKEKADCWRVYSMVTDHYQPNPERLRDWISAPKSNGYESLHTTVVIPGGEWVEIQIRTLRMNEIAEKGLAAHWKYKGIKGQAGIDQWIEKVRGALEGSDEDADNLIEDLKLSQFSKEIFVFTPTGDLKKFPENATVLDFAFDIHTDVGSTCAGARVNGNNVPIRYQLKNGDKVEIIRSKSQKPKPDWLNYVVSSKAKGKIKQAMKEEKTKEAEHGKEILKRRFRNWKIDYNDSSIRRVIQHFKYKDSIDLYYDVSTEKIDLLEIKEFLSAEEKPKDTGSVAINQESVERLEVNARQDVHDSNDFMVIDEELANVDFRLGKCCNPIHGDAIFGFVTISAGITIHRKNCPNAQQLLSRYPYRVVKARWKRSEKNTSFAVTLQVTGVDDLGIVSNISDVISKDLQVLMRSISIDSNDGMFEGSITLFVKDTQHLEALVRKLKKVKGVNNIRRSG